MLDDSIKVLDIHFIKHYSDSENGAWSRIKKKLEESAKQTDNTVSPKLSGTVCRLCYGHKDMCEKCVYGSEFSPADQHREGA